MSADLQTFVFDDEQPHPMRVVLREGAPWFVAKDVCAVLELSNPTMAVEPLDDDEKGRVSIQTLGRPDLSSTEGSFEQSREVVVVSEGGLYTLILRSRQATTPGSMAHRFRRWVTGELLPQIRKTGHYAPDPQDGWDWDDIASKLSMVREVRLTFGRKAAATLWKELGLPRADDPDAPPRREDATQGMDFVRMFLAERTAEAHGGRVQAAEMFRAYSQWAVTNAAPAMTETGFGRTLSLTGLKKSKSMGRVFYHGIRIRHVLELAQE